MWIRDFPEFGHEPKDICGSLPKPGDLKVCSLGPARSHSSSEQHRESSYSAFSGGQDGHRGQAAMATSVPARSADQQAVENDPSAAFGATRSLRRT